MDLNLQFCFVVILDKLKGTVAFPLCQWGEQYQFLYCYIIIIVLL